MEKDKKLVRTIGISLLVIGVLLLGFVVTNWISLGLSWIGVIPFGVFIFVILFTSWRISRV